MLAKFAVSIMNGLMIAKTFTKIKIGCAPPLMKAPLMLYICVLSREALVALIAR